MAKLIPKPKTCDTCGKIYTPHKSREDVSRFCSVKCRIKGHRWGKNPNVTMRPKVENEIPDNVRIT